MVSTARRRRHQPQLHCVPCGPHQPSKQLACVWRAKSERYDSFTPAMFTQPLHARRLRAVYLGAVQAACEPRLHELGPPPHCSRCRSRTSPLQCRWPGPACGRWALGLHLGGPLGGPSRGSAAAAERGRAVGLRAAAPGRRLGLVNIFGLHPTQPLARISFPPCSRTGLRAVGGLQAPLAHITLRRHSCRSAALSAVSAVAEAWC